MEQEAGSSGGPKATQKFICDFCGKSYSYQRGLNAHVKSSHSSQAPATSTKGSKATEDLLCHVCKKSYKTERGLLEHLKVHSQDDRTNATITTTTEILTSQRTVAVASTDAEVSTSPKPAAIETSIAGDIFEDIIREEEEEEIELSGASIEAAHAEKSTKTKHTVNPSKPSITCDLCGESFNSKNKFEKHSIEHKLAECYSRQISEGDLCNSIEDFMIQIFREILLEGSDFKKVVDKVLSEVSSSNWNTFVGSVSEHLIPCITSPKAIIPSVKYEEQLTVFNKLLNDHNKFSSLLNQLRILISDEDSTSPVMGMILFRLLSKLFEEVVTKVLNSMSCNSVQSEEINTSIDEEGFERHISQFIQAYYAKGVSSGSLLWITRCACVRKSFIETLNDDFGMSVETICKNSSWENNLVKLNPKVVRFFMSIEVTISSLLQSKAAVTPSAIIDDLFKEENVFKLDLWYALTASTFPVIESIAFMKELISAFVKLSLKLEVSRLRDIEIQGRPGKYALRTDLKRN